MRKHEKHPYKKKRLKPAKTSQKPNTIKMKSRCVWVWIDWMDAIYQMPACETTQSNDYKWEKKRTKIGSPNNEVSTPLSTLASNKNIERSIKFLARQLDLTGKKRIIIEIRVIKCTPCKNWKGTFHLLYWPFSSCEKIQLEGRRLLIFFFFLFLSPALVFQFRLWIWIFKRKWWDEKLI